MLRAPRQTIINLTSCCRTIVSDDHAIIVRIDSEKSLSARESAHLRKRFDFIPGSNSNPPLKRQLRRGALLHLFANPSEQFIVLVSDTSRGERYKATLRDDSGKKLDNERRSAKKPLSSATIYYDYPLLSAE
ncbi:hypothetical protein HN011_003866 [Eciton burchellii]|nr:hypothetical protein HN011_003866 [Eciton burchellii]